MHLLLISKVGIIIYLIFSKTFYK
uniref:Uncharacterized protein n=1 Tax=Heterorhabditis bacteriophora TaxID=37862 RepID=A0A1I7WJU2_HETBA